MFRRSRFDLNFEQLWRRDARVAAKQVAIDRIAIEDERSVRLIADPLSFFFLFFFFFLVVVIARGDEFT